ncbi:MAG TPA: guanylate kinase [Dehalococcoidia bacterium]|nr:guanylate kinase [Dehalococcoidia bacterium]
MSPTAGADPAAVEPLLVVLSGPSGAGKDAVLQALKGRGAPYHFVVTATTREPRPGEREGIDYHFLSEAEFLRLRDADGLVEYVLYHGTYRGVPKDQVRAALTAGRDAIMRTDVRGALAIKQMAPGAVLIFIAPPSLEALRQRMQARGEAPAAIRERLALARAELDAAPRFDYAVLNEDGRLDRAADQVQAIVTAEHCRIGRRPPSPS